MKKERKKVLAFLNWLNMQFTARTTFVSGPCFSYCSKALITRQIRSDLSKRWPKYNVVPCCAMFPFFVHFHRAMEVHFRCWCRTRIWQWLSISMISRHPFGYQQRQNACSAYKIHSRICLLTTYASFNLVNCSFCCRKSNALVSNRTVVKFLHFLQSSTICANRNFVYKS